MTMASSLHTSLYKFQRKINCSCMWVIKRFLSLWTLANPHLADFKVWRGFGTARKVAGSIFILARSSNGRANIPRLMWSIMKDKIFLIYLQFLEIFYIIYNN